MSDRLEEGIKKPDPKIFLLTCNRLDVRPEECVFIDDTLENVEAANKLGMKSFWWNKHENKIDQLNKLVSSYGIKMV